MENIEVLKKRLLYTSQHRGMREMDILLGRFAQRHIPLMNEQELKQFDTLLAYPDQELYGWFFENISIPETAPRTLVIAIQNDLIK